MENFMLKSCCVTGHRDIPAVKVDLVKEELRKQINMAIEDGYTHFISGMADGVDLYFANIVSEIKSEKTGITLEAAIPYRNRLKTKNSLFQRLIKLCDSVHIVAEEYSKETFLSRNMYMVGKSERVIAVYDGRLKGGTDFTIRYAKTRNKEIHLITVQKNIIR